MSKRREKGKKRKKNGGEETEGKEVRLAARIVLGLKELLPHVLCDSGQLPELEF